MKKPQLQGKKGNKMNWTKRENKRKLNANARKKSKRNLKKSKNRISLMTILIKNKIKKKFMMRIMNKMMMTTTIILITKIINNLNKKLIMMKIKYPVNYQNYLSWNTMIHLITLQDLYNQVMFKTRKFLSGHTKFILKLKYHFTRIILENRSTKVNSPQPVINTKAPLNESMQNQTQFPFSNFLSNRITIICRLKE